MSKIHWSKIRSHEFVEEICSVAAVFKLSFSRAPRDLQVEVAEYPEKTFIGIANYSFWGPSQATPYRSMGSKKSIEEALNDAISGIAMFYSEDYPSNVIFWEKSGQEGAYRKYIDGDGNQISYEEAVRRRDEYNRGKRT